MSSSSKWLLISQYLLACILILTLLISPLGAPEAKAWSGDPTENTAICTASDDQYDPTIMSDGSGGAIIAWEDHRSGTPHIYAQRVDSSGSPQWTADGVAICTASDWQLEPTIVSDGAGGAIITWHDGRSGINNHDIYAQRVDSTGALQWAADGVAICTASEDQYIAAIASDGSGGAICTWYDWRRPWHGGLNCDIYAQRVDSTGALQWTSDGVAICTALYSQYDMVITSDGAGGAIISWRDNRSGTEWDIYAQRVDSSGALQWTANGVAICTASDDQWGPVIASDGAGGAIVTWQDYRNDPYGDIYAQRVESSGAPQWAADGVTICTASDDQLDPLIVSDGAGGAIISWRDNRSGTEWDIYAQRVDSSGTTQWTADGVAICTAGGGQWSPVIVSDGSGGAIIAWEDLRGYTSTWGIYAQRVGSAGTTQWTADGVAICTAGGGQWSPVIVSDGSGGAIIAWEDYRNGNYDDIYAQWVDFSGELLPEVHTWNLFAAGFVPKHLPDEYTGQVVLADLDPATIPAQVQGVWWYDGAALDYKFWVPGVGGDLTTITGQSYNYMVLVSGGCAWEIPLP